jgi:hypothetical protein
VLYHQRLSTSPRVWSFYYLDKPSHPKSSPPKPKASAAELFNHLINSKGFSIAELTRIIAILIQQS